MTRSPRWWPLCLGLVAGFPASAVELTPWLKFDGFGTLAAYRGDDPVAGARSDQRTSQYTSNKEWRFDGDSQLTGQFTLNPSGPVRGVLQVLSKDDVTERFKPRVEWLYASWDISADWTVKGGRVVAPVFLLSDTRNVGYAQTAVRPNQTVYQINPITSLDGVNVNWAKAVGGGNLSFEAAFGKTELNLTSGKIDVKRTSSLALKWSQGPWTVRWGRSDFRLDGSLPATQAALNALSSGATACTNCATVLPARFAFTDIKGHIDTLAGTIEQGDWLVQAEWTRRLSNSALVPDIQGWYAQLGYRVGDFTPYAAVGGLKVTEGPLGLQTHPAAPASAAAANAAFEHYLRNPNDRDTWQLGVRWEVRENFALKLQWESIKNTRAPFLGMNSVIYSPTTRPIGTYIGPAWDGKMNVLSVNLDFVF
ncbi:hypothetical protein [Inhella gelatinilytica]|uniref:Porin n=1 Tax=Inhella gelatinilytica TaxID=2795030 RepID=A0A931IX06_9BURK|nr:hypothetical protein [Inhella gelatinilytica]MBH9552208.1 hypothetical protein [Inhella gelatinilytica]